MWIACNFVLWQPSRFIEEDLMAKIKYRCQPAYHVVTTIGDVTYTASKLGLTQSAVSRWITPVEQGGTGGVIPQRHWDAILEMCPTLDVYDLSGHPRP